jgi:hypothetical protein
MWISTIEQCIIYVFAFNASAFLLIYRKPASDDWQASTAIAVTLRLFSA